MIRKYLTLIALMISTLLCAQIPTAGLVAYYPFNGNANDESGNNFDGTVSGAILATDRNGNDNSAFSFDGNDKITIPNDVKQTSAHSYSIWILVNSWSGTSTVGIIGGRGLGNSTARGGIALSRYFGNESLYYDIYNSNTRKALIFDDSPITLGEWKHIVLTWDGTSGTEAMKLYLDGMLVGLSQGLIGPINWGNYNFTIGYNGSKYFTGSLDDIRIYNVALDLNDIEALYKEGGTPPPGGPSPWTQSGSNIYYNSGNVGIGTTNPLSLLSVDGLIRAEEIKVVTDVDVPDYVFESNYPLRSLEDLRKYIHNEGHLPDIPSAAEIRLANGFELGDMDMRLLRKIEELTLYTLEQEERIEELRQQIDHLKEILNKLVNDQ